MNAYVDEELCIGCGSCAAVCSAVFQLADNGLAYADNDRIDGATESCVSEAAGLCPTSAITLS